MLNNKFTLISVANYYIQSTDYDFLLRWILVCPEITATV